ncbi:hypothetical protein BpHYR1_049468 [Brachionus plicatilis]|uniref:Uncharacterized protein n=1 Tax=Brachionus plicatilis TaxID=10195 RepID=A0A3M7Q7E0_BRAPC|nr:hypothetical protein BpHYR1_049468 [Brachionus plicatilis]
MHPMLGHICESLFKLTYIYSGSNKNVTPAIRPAGQRHSLLFGKFKENIFIWMIKKKRPDGSVGRLGRPARSLRSAGSEPQTGRDGRPCWPLFSRGFFCFEKKI